VLEGVSLDQLRTFIAAVDEGSFSGAARKLNRVQSAVSSWISDLEDQFGVVLFDRSGRFPKLTQEGVLLLADARSIVAGVATMKARARLMASGLETELAIVIDVFFPAAVLSATAKAFASRFPLTPLRLFVEGMGAGYTPVLEGKCNLGVLTNIPVPFPSLVSERLGEVPLVAVASPTHPLAQLTYRIPRHEMAKHLQLVLTDRSELMSGRDFGVVASSTWRLADLSTKYAFLKDGIGWGGMPLHMVEADVAAGALVILNDDDVPPGGFMLTMSAYHRTSDPPGPAGRWFIDHLKNSWENHLSNERGL
jgi:DNA-binding transcriptional LysR family regulator